MQYKNAQIYTKDFRYEPGAFAVEDGVFARVFGEAGPEAVDLQGAKVLPGLIDQHTHGCAGADFSDGDGAGLLRMARYYAARGVTGFAATSMTLPREQLEKALDSAARFRETAPEGAARLLGVHMEGPFFNPARCGAQDPAHLRLPDPEMFRQLDEHLPGLIRILSLAPELEGALPLIEEAAQGHVVSLGHTEADYDTARRAFAAGASQLTHAFNAMPGIHHRAPGPLAAAAEDERVSVELIGDGIHIHPAALRLAFRLFGVARIVLISDSLRCCGMPEGEYELAGRKVVLKDGAARLPDGTLAGSAADLFTCLRRVIASGVPECEAIRACTWNPAGQLGCLDRLGSIENGKMADFVVCGEDLAIRRVFIGGKAVDR